MKATIIGTVRFSQLLYDTPARANPAINDAIVGAIMFKRPEAVAKATTAISLVDPANSATGAIIGIEASAKPDDEGIINDIGI